MVIRYKACIGALVVLAWVVSLALAEVRLPSVIGDNMVLQRGTRVPIWGWAAPGEMVTVSLAGQRAGAVADARGHWQVWLRSLRAGGPFELTVAGSNNTLTVRNVLVGEVWVASGQSNMGFRLHEAQNARLEIAQASYPDIRTFIVKQTVATEPQSDCQGSWQQCSPKTAGGFSAVAYFFARELHRTLGVPVGIIDSSWGGTPAESWTDRASLEADPELRPFAERTDQLLADYAKASAAKPAPEDPRTSWLPSSLYQGMIAPLLPYAVAGVIWYQGESNAGRAYQYRKLFPAMIRGWRRNWGQGDFPFLFVQLANFTPSLPEPGESDWAELREAQCMTLSLPHTGQAVTIDIGDAADIHPKNKQEVGRRLALIALATCCGHQVVYAGPTYESMAREGSKIRLRFRDIAGGLVAGDGAALRGFAIAGQDRKFVWADAVVEGSTVIVSSPQVAAPVAVRYAWANDPVCNLYNTAGLPASPFRTDDWPGVTAGKQ